MTDKRWIIADSDDATARVLSAKIGISQLTAQLLVNRGVREPDEAKKFLQPDLKGLLEPSRFGNMEKAVARLVQAVKKKEKIAVFGDYDVDGITGTTIIVRFFRLLGMEVESHIPHRTDEGYGLNLNAIGKFASKGVDVLITIDCGTANNVEVEAANREGMDVVILDHHEQPPDPAPAHAIINPKLKGEPYPFEGICSAGIAYKMVWGLAEALHVPRSLGEVYGRFMYDALGLAALGTLADVSPLVGENRVFVTFGLEALPNTSITGLRALMEKARLTGKKIDGFDVAFRIAPRLNAVGRIGEARHTLELMVSDSTDRVAEIVDMIEKANVERRAIEAEIAKQAMEQVRNQIDVTREKVIVVADSRWHTGVVGIVASRLVEAFYRPAFVLSIQDEVAKGSARSITGFPLHEAMESCTELLMQHGGHAMAAGVTLPQGNLGAFRERLNEFADRILTDDDFLPAVNLDAEVPLSSLTEAVVREIGSLAPYGPGNPQPVFAVKGARIAGAPRLMGKRSNHISFHVAQEGPALRAVGFGWGEAFDDLTEATNCSLAFTPEINSWKGRDSVELKVKDIQFL